MTEVLKVCEMVDFIMGLYVWVDVIDLVVCPAAVVVSRVVLGSSLDVDGT